MSATLSVAFLSPEAQEAPGGAGLGCWDPILSSIPSRSHLHDVDKSSYDFSVTEKLALELGSPLPASVSNIFMSRVLQNPCPGPSWPLVTVTGDKTHGDLSIMKAPHP